MMLAVYVGFRLSELLVLAVVLLAAGFVLGLSVCAWLFRDRSTMGARD